MLYIFDEPECINEEFPECMLSLLSEDRSARVEKLRSQANRNASIIAYLLLRLALKNIYGINEAVEFDYAQKGKPGLLKYPDIHFNLSHSKSAIACVVSSVEVGVDVQDIVSVNDKVAKRVLTDDEFIEFKSSNTPDEYFCKIWTIKESVVKRTGQGLASDFRKITASEVVEITTYKGKNYFCSVCGPEMQTKFIRRENFEELR